MSKLIELIETVENEFNSNEHKTLQNMYGMPESIKRIITLTKIIRLQNESIEYYKKQCRPCNSMYAEHEEGFKNDKLQGCDCLVARHTLEETNRIAGGESSDKREETENIRQDNVKGES